MGNIKDNNNMNFNTDSDVISDTVKKSDLNARDGFDLDKIILSNPLLIDCSYTEKKEEVDFFYKVSGLRNVTELKQGTAIEKIQFLINFAELEKICDRIKLNLSQDSIYYDDNLCLKIKKRDIYGINDKKTDFLYYYKSVICGLMSSKYSIDDIESAGPNLLRSDKGLTRILDSKSTDELVGILKDKKSQIAKDTEDNTICVRKKTYKIKHYLSIISTVMFILCAGLIVYYIYFPGADKERIIQGNQAYNQPIPDYQGCIEAMKELKISNMDKNTKYILAVSYAKTESLNRSEIDSIVSRLSTESDQRELEYWINLGRLDMEEAANLAKSLSNDQLLMYAYMRDLDSLEGNTSLSGGEKEKRISELEDKIKTLGDKYSDDSEKDN